MEDLIKEVDPSLKYFVDLPMGALYTALILVEGVPYVFKSAWDCKNTNGFSWQLAHLRKEVRVLNNLPEINGVPKIIRTYGENGKEHSLVKTYFEGRSTLVFDNGVKNTDLQDKLTKLIENLHSEGIAGFDLKNGGNVIVSYDDKNVYLCDFGKTIFHRDVGESAFEKVKSHDMKNLEKYIFRR